MCVSEKIGFLVELKVLAKPHCVWACVSSNAGPSNPTAIATSRVADSPGPGSTVRRSPYCCQQSQQCPFPHDRLHIQRKAALSLTRRNIRHTRQLGECLPSTCKCKECTRRIRLKMPLCGQSATELSSGNTQHASLRGPRPLRPLQPPHPTLYSLPSDCHLHRRQVPTS
jgi:hypothetical protein